MNHRIAALLGMILIAGCATSRDAGPPAPHAKLDAVLWMGTAGERSALAEQTFRLARLRLEERLQPPHRGESAALEQPGPTSLPPAVIVDVDETVLDNGEFAVEFLRQGGLFDPDLWSRWVRRQAAVPVPGAVAFLQHADSLGVRVFYVTNRSHELEDATRANLAAYGLPVDADGANILSLGERESWGEDKTPRRAFIARTHRIVLIIGDDLGDFSGGAAEADPESRARWVRSHASRWGVSWIVLPNPVYGTWERSLYGFEESSSQEEILRRKREALDAIPIEGAPGS